MQPLQGCQMLVYKVVVIGKLQNLIRGKKNGHYNDVIKIPMASQITSVSILSSSVCSGADVRKHQSSVSLAFVMGIHRWPVNYPHTGPVTRKMVPFADVIMVPYLFTLTTTWLLSSGIKPVSVFCVQHKNCSTVFGVYTDLNVVTDLVPWWRHQMEAFSALLAICAEIHRSPVNSTHKCQWHRGLMISLISVWINGWVNNRDRGWGFETPSRSLWRHYNADFGIRKIISHWL